MGGYPLGDCRRRADHHPAADDLRWALGRIEQRFKATADELSADAAFIRTAKAAFRAKPDGLTRSGAINVISRLRYALSRYGVTPFPSADHAAIPARRTVRAALPLPSPAWQALLAVLPGSMLTFHLEMFVRWCTKGGVEPVDVGDATFGAYETKSADRLLHPAAHMRDLRAAWKRAAALVPGWPQVVPPEPPKRTPFTVAEADMAPELIAALRAHFDARLAASGRRGRGRPRPDPRAGRRKGSRFALREESARKSFDNVRLYLGALRSCGVDIRTITTLTELLDPDLVDRGIAVLEQRTRVRETGTQACNVAGTLGALAHHTGASDEVVEALRAIRADVAPAFDGMVLSRRREIEPFRDPVLQKRLLELPYALSIEAHKTGAHKGALLMQSAIAIELLLVSVMRIRNIGTLNLDDHIVDVGKGRARRVTLFVRSDEVKNTVNRQKLLAPDTVGLLDIYVTDFRPHLAKVGDRYLFPGDSRDGGKAISVLGRQITKVIKTYLGHHLGPHSFRALAVLLYLKANPGDFESMVHVLGHKGLVTLLTHYRWKEVEESFAAYQAVVTKSRHVAPQIEKLRELRRSATFRGRRQS